MHAWSVSFDELYRRHLCRHSQYGNNVVHLASLIGTYWALYGLFYLLVPWPWAVLAVAAPYVVVLAATVPLRVFAVTLLFLAGFFTVFLAVPPFPWWGYVAALPVFYKIQQWGHVWFPRENDMTEFNKKYRKGPGLFLLLSAYELPIQLNYLVFGKKDWCA
jgi:hypothetical protein